MNQLKKIVSDLCLAERVSPTALETYLAGQSLVAIWGNALESNKGMTGKPARYISRAVGETLDLMQGTDLSLLSFPPITLKVCHAFNLSSIFHVSMTCAIRPHQRSIAVGASVFIPSIYPCKHKDKHEIVRFWKMFLFFTPIGK